MRKKIPAFLGAAALIAASVAFAQLPILGTGALGLSYREAARALRAKLADEDGVTTAADQVEDAAARH